MNRQVSILSLILSILCGYKGFTQNLYVPANATITLTNDAQVHAQGDIQNDGIIAGSQGSGLATDQNLNNAGVLGLAGDSELTIAGNGVNDNSLTSAGTVYLGGDWTNNSISNFVSAELIFNGTGAQQFNDNAMLVTAITVASTGPVTLNASITITNPDDNIDSFLDFQSGTLTSVVDGSLILDESASAMGGSETSYYDGTLISRGTGFKYFPVGDNGHFGPVEFDNIEGINTEIAVNHIWTNPTDPVPNSDLIGVSSNGLWSVELLSGSFDGSRLFLDFMDEDLENFVIFNEVNATNYSPVIAFADSAGGEFGTLGVTTLENTDSISYGRILSDSLLVFSDTSNIRYFALAKAPQVSLAGVWYIPEAFSPHATNPVNQTFRFFGERISNEGFMMRVYNRKRILVYETTDFIEATQVGWDGTNVKTGKDEPSGVYFYQIIFTREPVGMDPVTENKTGKIYLIR